MLTINNCSIFPFYKILWYLDFYKLSLVDKVIFGLTTSNFETKFSELSCTYNNQKMYLGNHKHSSHKNFLSLFLLVLYQWAQHHEPFETKTQFVENTTNIFWTRRLFVLCINNKIKASTFLLIGPPAPVPYLKTRAFINEIKTSPSPLCIAHTTV